LLEINLQGRLFRTLWHSLIYAVNVETHTKKTRKQKLCKLKFLWTLQQDFKTVVNQKLRKSKPRKLRNACIVQLTAITLCRIVDLFFILTLDCYRASMFQEIACHFSQDHGMVTKILDFIHKHSEIYYLDRFSRNLAKTNKTFKFFGIEIRKIDFFFNFSLQKSLILFQI
jgi:hypothetical protein